MIQYEIRSRHSDRYRYVVPYSDHNPISIVLLKNKLEEEWQVDVDLVKVTIHEEVLE